MFLFQYSNEYSGAETPPFKVRATELEQPKHCSENILRLTTRLLCHKCSGLKWNNSVKARYKIGLNYSRVSLVEIGILFKRGKLVFIFTKYCPIKSIYEYPCNQF